MNAVPCSLLGEQSPSHHEGLERIYIFQCDFSVFPFCNSSYFTVLEFVVLRHLSLFFSFVFSVVHCCDCEVSVNREQTGASDTEIQKPVNVTLLVCWTYY